MNSQAEVSALLSHLQDQGRTVYWSHPAESLEQMKQIVDGRNTMLWHVANGSLDADECVRVLEASGWAGQVGQVVQAMVDSQPRESGGFSTEL